MRNEPQNRVFSSKIVDFQMRNEPQNRAFSSLLRSFQRNHPRLESCRPLHRKPARCASRSSNILSIENDLSCNSHSMAIQKRRDEANLEKSPAEPLLGTLQRGSVSPYQFHSLYSRCRSVRYIAKSRNSKFQTIVKSLVKIYPMEEGLRR